MKTAELHKGANWWLLEPGSTGFDSKAHGPYSSEAAARERAETMGLRIVEAVDVPAENNSTFS